jgi:hypothetical protein
MIEAVVVQGLGWGFEVEQFSATLLEGSET